MPVLKLFSGPIWKWFRTDPIGRVLFNLSIALGLLGIMLFFLIFVIPFSSAPDLLHQAHEVKIYRMNWEDSNGQARLIDRDGKLNDTLIPEDGVLLDQDDIEDLAHASRGPLISWLGANCHQPHHAILFRNKQGELIGWISICIKCSTTKVSGNELSAIWSENRLANLIRKKGIPVANPEWK